MSNPFRLAGDQAKPLPDPEDVSHETAICDCAELLWDLIDRLPRKADATLAQRRLQEAVFWAMIASRQVVQ